MLICALYFYVLTGEGMVSKIDLSSPVASAAWLLSILWRWFCYCLLIVYYCYSHCFVGVSVWFLICCAV